MGIANVLSAFIYRSFNEFWILIQIQIHFQSIKNNIFSRWATINVHEFNTYE